MTSLRGLATEAFKRTLVEGEYVSASELHDAEDLALKKNYSVIDALLELKLLSKDLVGQVSAQSLGLTFAEEDSLPSTREMIQHLDEKTARSKRLVYMRESEKEVEIASDTEQKQDDLDKLFPNKKVILHYTLPEYVDAALRLYDAPLAKQFEELSGKTKSSISDIVSIIFDHAIDEKVSDIHFEPGTDDVAIRFRIDGVLLQVGRIPKSFYEKVRNRIKVLAQLPIDEHMRSQDGSLRHTRPEGVVNIRVSIAPTLNGEKIVLRLLSSYRGFTVEELGLSESDRAILESSAQKPFGMILTVGPTGSGKTTTLYAFLQTRNTHEVNITTIEDPVEFKIPGLNQMQVNPLTDLTFARGLRSIVRQDPDIVLVGEIRDRETAEIAVNAALTGRLLFSTFHSNDAATTIPRLIDMGVEPFLLSSTIELIVAQRLVRRICENCKVSHALSARQIKLHYPVIEPYLKKQTSITVYRGEGCDACHHTGYRGRVGIFEMIRNSPELQDCIVTSPNRVAIWNVARTQGSRSLFEDGLDKVMQGATSIEELLRVAKPDVH